MFSQRRSEKKRTSKVNAQGSVQVKALHDRGIVSDALNMNTLEECHKGGLNTI